MPKQYLFGMFELANINHLLRDARRSLLRWCAIPECFELRSSATDQMGPYGEMWG